MGYASTIIVVYGVELTAAQAKLLYDAVLPPGTDEDDLNVGEILEKTIPQEKLTEYASVPENATILQHKDGIQLTRDHHGKPNPRYVHRAQCYSHGTDSRIHSLHFDIEEGCEHTFGIYCGSRGYAYQDKIEDIIVHIPERAKSNFNEFCAPILSRIGITEQPTVRLITQVW